MTRIVNIGEALIDEITRPNTAPVEVVGGSMLTEVVFAYPGIGYQLFSAVGAPNKNI